MKRSLVSLLATLPPERPVAPRPAPAKIIVLDDDPTGTQSVHGVPVLTIWTVDALAAELLAPDPCCYLLTNSRALPPASAGALIREVGANLAAAAARTGRPFRVVCRGDSTLRGHYPLETDVLAETLGPFDATLLVPAFFDGGRLTIDDIHYVAEGGLLVPAAETEFARDAAFGYRASNLREWVEEKTGGRVRAAEVASISLRALRADNGTVAAQLSALRDGKVAVINAAAPSDLARLTVALAAAEASGRRFLFRTAASFVAAYAGIASRPPLAAAEIAPLGPGGGLVVVGSHVGRTTAQLEALRQLRTIESVELSVEALLAEVTRAGEIARTEAEVGRLLSSGRDVVLFTSRRLVSDPDAARSLEISTRVSSALVEIVRELPVQPRWLIAKGGITASDLATRALGVRRALVLGQALPGVPVWQTGPESRWPSLAYVIFPGNVGGPEALATLVASLSV